MPPKLLLGIIDHDPKPVDSVLTNQAATDG
jgi:hypothetical protein